MAVSNIHLLHAVELTDATTPVVIDGITAHSLDLAPNIQRQSTSAQSDPRFQYINAIAPTGQFTTLKIAQALAAIGYDGLDISSRASGINLYGQAAQEGGNRKSGSNHRKYNILEGMVIPVSLTCNHQSPAELQYSIVTSYDGTNDPVVESDSVALPTLSGDDERFGLGPCTLESISIGQLQSLTIDFGITVQAVGADSDIYPTFPYISQRMPTITLRGTDITVLGSGSIPRTGLEVTHANTSIFLRKYDQGGRFVADATAEHIEFTTDGIATVGTAMDATGVDPAEIEVTINCRDDGTNDALVIDTAIAIP